MIFVAAVFFVLLLYVLPLRYAVIENLRLFPIMGPEGSYIVTSALIFLIILLILYLMSQFHELFWPRLPYVIKDEVTRRTGIHKIEFFGFWISAIALVIFFAVDMISVPLGLASMVGFGWLMGQPVTLRTVGSVRESRRSPLPASDGGGSAEESIRENLEKRRFQWRFDKPASDPIIGEIEVTIDKNRYRSFAEKNPYRGSGPPLKNYKNFVAGGITDEVFQIAAYLVAASNEYQLSPYEEIAFTLSFVKSVPYKPDSETKGKTYLRFPVETLFENVGDGDCRAILFATLLKAINYDVVIVESGGETAVAVGGAEGIPGRFFEYDGRRFFYCPTGDGGVSVGQLPPDKAADRFKVYAV